VHRSGIRYRSLRSSGPTRDRRPLDTFGAQAIGQIWAHPAERRRDCGHDREQALAGYRLAGEQLPERRYPWHESS